MPTQPQQQLQSSDLATAQREAFDQLASQVQAQINAGGGQAPMMFGNSMMPPFMGTTMQQQHLPMMWHHPPEAGPAASYPVPMTQLSTSNLSPSITAMSPLVSTASMAPPPMAIPVSEPAMVTSTRKSSGKKSSAATKRASKATTSMASDTDSADEDDSKAQHSRERNREHARSTRLRKKAYIQKLKDMADGLRSVQTEEIRQRRISMQKLLEVQKVRRAVVQTALQYHATNQQDPVKWNVLLEDSFWLKQPVTPFRSFRRSEVERVSLGAM
jgi:hypothetical protein